jgi:hypothetical protein
VCTRTQQASYLLQVGTNNIPVLSCLIELHSLVRGVTALAYMPPVATADLSHNLSFFHTAVPPEWVPGGELFSTWM